MLDRSRRFARSDRFLPGTDLMLLAGIAFVAVLGGCAQQPAATGASTPGAAARGTGSSWALPTSTMLWNDYALDLIARNQVGQFPAARTL